MLRIVHSFWIGIVLCLFSAHPLVALWYAPITLSGTTADEPQVSSDLLGNVVAVWREFDGTNTSIRSISAINAGLKSAVTISSVVGSYVQANPQVVMDPVSKTSVAVWEELNGSNSTVKAATLTLGGTWSAPVDISTAATESGQFPKIAVSSSKHNVVAVWRRYDGTHNIIQAATLTIGGSWSTAVDISSSLIDSHSPQIKIDGSGNAVAVWHDATDQTIQYATLPYGGSWSSPVDLSASDANIPRVAINSSGYVVAVWERFNGSYFAIQASTLQFGGSWSTPVEISTAVTENAFEARAAVDTNGNALAAWEQVSGSDILIQAAYLPSGGSWAAPATLSSIGTFSFDPDVAFDSSGGAFAVWDSDSGGNMIIQASTLPFGGSWSAATQISAFVDNTISPHISVASVAGSAVVCWTNYTLGVIQATAWIPAPVVTNVSPNSGSVLGGETITVTGRGFVNVGAVYFGSIPCRFVVISPFQISATAPSGSAGTVDITVATPPGVSSITANDNYTYQLSAPTPTVTTIYLNHGPLRGGNSVKIIGTNFVGVTQVNFGLTAATSYSVVSPTLIIATVPAGSGTVDITVTASGGTSATTTLDQYTYD